MNLRVAGMGRNLGENVVNPAVVYEILKNLKSEKKKKYFRV